MARGNASKEIITDVIMRVFPNAFMNGKEIRIPLSEDGEEVQVKVTLTAAKENVSHEGAATVMSSPANQWQPPSQADIDRVIQYLKDMGF